MKIKNYATRFIIKSLTIITFYNYFVQDYHYTYKVDALLYHQIQSVPLLSRVNRQPQPQQQQQQHEAYHQRQQYDGSGTSSQQYEPLPFVPASGLNGLTDNFGCPLECQCNRIAQIADCSNRNLTRVPIRFPKDIKRIRLERNNITEIGPYAFEGLNRLQRIDLSNNNLQLIDALAFSGGLTNLNSLILYSNKLDNLPVNVFSELNQLQLLLLNANSLHAIHRDLFQALPNLNLLSLYDNNIETLQKGTFDGLKSIKTIHLGKNPLNCDCNLRWLAEYFDGGPVETSEARCETPRSLRIQGKKLSQLSKTEFNCSESQQPAASKGSQQQQQPTQANQDGCPVGCFCSGSTVDCSRAGASASREHRAMGGVGNSANSGIYELPDIPDDVPVYVARVHINDQRIKRIRQTGLFRRLANSQKLDLGNNKIIDVEDNAIGGRFSNGQKPERVVFVLLENQHCSAPVAGSIVEGPPVPIDPCASAPKVNEPHFDSPCYNGGSCKSISGAASNSSTQLNYSCMCPPGFAGSLCEINIDDCADHQCQNGAMCVDAVNSYRCVCRDPTTSGEFCEQLASSSSASSSSISFPYATGSAAAALRALPLAAPPLALPIISNGRTAVGVGSAAQPNELINSNFDHLPSTPPSSQQIWARSADFARLSGGASHNSDERQQQLVVPSDSSVQIPSALNQPNKENRPVTGNDSCQRLTQRKYFDDGNGCQSVRLLKLSTCAGSCEANGNCCLPARVKRRRIRMQCNDGASYVKTIELIKKCSCGKNSDCSVPGAPNRQETSADEAAIALNEKTKSTQYFKYLTSSGVSTQTQLSHSTNQHGRKSQQDYSVRPTSEAGSSLSSQDDQTMRLDAVD